MDPGKSVSLNLNVRGLGQSATLAIKDRCRALRAEGREVFDFGLGQSPFPVPEPVVEALRAAASEKDYLPVKGLPALRRAVVEYHRRTDALDFQPEHVLVGPGSKELMFLVQLVYYGEIMLTPPCWVSYWPQARILGRRFSLLHSGYEHQWKISAEQLQRSIEMVGDDHRPRLLVLNYPSNPTGATYAERELRELAEVARRFELIVLSDEIYGQLHFAGGHISIARYYPEGTIVSSGLSKWCGAGGWRLGTFSFPPALAWLADALAAVASETYTSVSAPIQHAAIRAFTICPVIQDYLRHCRRVLAGIAQRICPLLNDARVRVHSPEGGFYLYLDFTPHAAALAARGIHDGRRLCERLLADTGVAVLPGAAFGRARGDLAARLAFVDFDGAAALEASRRQGSVDEPLPDGFVDRYCAQVIAGVTRICTWAAGS